MHLLKISHGKANHLIESKIDKITEVRPSLIERVALAT